MNIIDRIKKKLRRKPKSWLLHDKFQIVPAFDWHGQTYYMHSDPLNTLAGRGLTSLVFMEELIMRCDIRYLQDHVEAMAKVLSDPKRIDISAIAQLNSNLKERINFLIAVPDHVYKLASVVFFTKDESPFNYDRAAGQRKIKSWTKSPDMYAFFLQTPLKDLLPFLALPESNSQQYLEVMGKINDLHLSHLQDILSNNR